MYRSAPSSSNFRWWMQSMPGIGAIKSNCMNGWRNYRQKIQWIIPTMEHGAFTSSHPRGKSPILYDIILWETSFTFAISSLFCTARLIAWTSCSISSIYIKQLKLLHHIMSCELTMAVSCSLTSLLPVLFNMTFKRSGYFVTRCIGLAKKSFRCNLWQSGLDSHHWTKEFRPFISL